MTQVNENSFVPRGAKVEKTVKQKLRDQGFTHRSITSRGKRLHKSENDAVKFARQNHEQVSEAVSGKKLIELLMQALQEGDAVRVTEYVNQMLSQKVSSALGEQRKMIAEQLFNEDLADLVKASNLNRDDETDSPEPEDEALPNAELADLGADEDETFGEGSESPGLDTFRA